jgi:hypothetical protein
MRGFLSFPEIIFEHTGDAETAQDGDGDHSANRMHGAP